MTITLRDYQQKSLDDLRAAYRAGFRRPLLVSPTGSGKTIEFCAVVKGRIARGGRPMILTHRSELIEQVDRELRKFGVTPGIIAADYPASPHAAVQIGSVFTVVKRIGRIAAPDLIVVDEAHHCTTKTTWGRILNSYPQAVVLGVTATPTRLSGEGLGDVFDTLVVGPTTQELIDLGALSPVSVYAPPGPDLSGVHTRMGDYVQSELEAVMSGGTVMGDAVDHYRRLAHQLPAVAFCVSVDHAHKVAAKFREGGYTSVSIDGSLDKHIRKQIVDDFRRGAINVLTSCDLISEGFDVPRLTVGILLRSTQSTGLHLQQIGRCLRPFEGKTRAVILDHAGNTIRHGLPTDHREWTLAAVPRPERGNKKQQPLAGIRVCKQCFAATPAGKPVCAECGADFPVERKVLEIDGTLEEVSGAAGAARRHSQQNPAADLNALIQLGKSRGYKNPHGWATHVWKARLAKRTGRLRGFRYGE